MARLLMLFLICPVAVFISFSACCQSKKNSSEIPFGIFIMSGGSRGIDRNPNSLVNNQVASLNHGYVAVGVYRFFKIRNDSISGLVRYLKVDFAYFASRSGTFDAGNGNLVRLNTTSADLSVILPISFKVTSELEGYMAFGPILSYRFNRDIIPSQSLPGVSTGSAFRPGFVIEFGFKTLSGSAFGTRAMAEFNDYPYAVGTLFFAFWPTNKTKIK